MDGWLAEVILAVVVFAATNVDDLVVIVAFLSDPAMRARAVVAGQLLGIAALVAGCALIASLALAVPPAWIALLGLVPLGMGVRQLLAARKPSAVTGAEQEAQARALERRVEGRLHSQALAVAGVTIANGGDNVGVYVPLFAADLGRVPLYAAVFLALTLVWCAVGLQLVNAPVVAARLQRHGHIVLPFVLIALGLAILSGLVL